VLLIGVAVLDGFLGTLEDADLCVTQFARPSHGQRPIPLGGDRLAELLVVEGARRPHGVLEDRLPEAGAFGELDVAPDGWAIDPGAGPCGAVVALGLEELLKVGDDFFGV